MRTQHEAVEGVEASAERGDPRVAEAQVPFAQHVGPVPQSLQLVRQEGETVVQPVD